MPPAPESTAPGGDLAGAVLVGAMWWYAGTVLYPAQVLKRAGLGPRQSPQGDPPVPVGGRGLGPYFSRRHRLPVLLEGPPEHGHLVHQFDRVAGLYDAMVRPFSRPIFEEALSALRPFLRRDARVLDVGCGPGRELRRLARLVPDGEVVGVDLAAEMVNTAHRAARAAGLDNCAFFQADAGDLPREFRGRFDLVCSFLAHHHFPDPAAAARSSLRCLRPGGLYCVVDPGPEWYNRLSAPLARWADPGWVGFLTPSGYRSLFEDVGFVRGSWREVLPGFGLAIGQKAPRRDPLVPPLK